MATLMSSMLSPILVVGIAKENNRILQDQNYNPKGVLPFETTVQNLK